MLSHRDFWSRHVFVLIASDTVHRGLHGDLIARLRKEDFTPVAARAVRASPETIDDLYADLIAGQWRTWRYRLVDSLMTIGPAMGVICHYSGKSEDPYALLSRRKGYQHPRNAELGTIRRDLGAINAVMNLMHSSDGPEESEREAAVFGLSIQDTDADTERAQAAVDYLVSLIAPPVPERREFDATLASVRTKALAAQWNELPETVRTSIRETFPLPGDLVAPGAGEHLAELLSQGVDDRLLATVRSDFTPEWRESITMSEAEENFRRLGVVLDPWERLVLESSLQFAPLRSGGDLRP